MPDSTLRPEWQQRVLDEHHELHDRLTRLENALDARAVPDDQALILRAQAAVMRNYLTILRLRIARF